MIIYDVIPGFRQYFYSLPPELREQVLSSGAEVASIGELMRLTESLAQNVDYHFPPEDIPLYN